MPGRSFRPEGLAPGGREPVGPAASPAHGRPVTLDQARTLEAMQGRVDGSGWKVEMPVAPTAQGLDDRVPMARPRFQGGQE